MRLLPLFFFLFLVSNAIYGGGQFIIRPVGGTTAQTSVRNGVEPNRQMNQFGGYFRLKEVSPATQQPVETEMVTYFVAKRTDRTISFSVNCARPVQLHFVIRDESSKHRIRYAEPSPYYRFEKEFDIAAFRNGACRIEVMTEKNELLYTIGFEKVASVPESSN